MCFQWQFSSGAATIRLIYTLGIWQWHARNRLGNRRLAYWRPMWDGQAVWLVAVTTFALSLKPAPIVCWSRPSDIAVPPSGLQSSARIWPRYSRGCSTDRLHCCNQLPFFSRLELLDSVFRLERAGTIRVFNSGQESLGRVRARVTCASARSVCRITRSDVDGNSRVDTAAAAFDQVNEPGWRSGGHDNVRCRLQALRRVR